MSKTTDQAREYLDKAARTADREESQAYARVARTLIERAEAEEVDDA